MGAYVGAVEEMCVVYVSVTEGIVVMDVIWRRPLRKYDLRKGDLFVLSWARMRRVR